MEHILREACDASSLEEIIQYAGMAGMSRRMSSNVSGKAFPRELRRHVGRLMWGSHVHQRGMSWRVKKFFKPSVGEPGCPQISGAPLF